MSALAATLAMPAAAQDAGDADTPAPADVEDRERIETLVRTLNNPSVLRDANELRDRIDRLLSSDHEAARSAIRRIVADTGARAAVVETIITSVLTRGALELLPEVVERLRVERESSLGRAFDDVLLFADTALVGQLADLARDSERSVDFRATAAALLGRTCHAEALPPLLDLWSEDDRDVRLAASRAFVRIVPFVDSRKQAAAVVAELRQERIPLAELLRRRMRTLLAEAPGVDEDYQDEYVELARTALPHMPLPDLLRLYLTSAVPGLRAAAAVRLREFPWDAQAEPLAARRAAGKALLRALRREEVAEIEGELLDTLLPLAPALRENVDDDELGALLVRARGDGGAGRPVRRAAIRLLGALRDRRPVKDLQAEFDALHDTDPELRSEILAALASTGADLTTWLAERVLEEPDVRVAREMVLRLGQADDPRSVGVLVQLLRDGHPDERLRSYVVQALASLWANRGEPRARDALVELGLRDPVAAIREFSANGLANPGPGDREPVLAALGDVAQRADEDAKVRVAAVRAVLDLDPTGALARLRPVLDVPALWDVVRNRMTEDLRGSHVTVEDVLAASDRLWDAGDPVLQGRAVQLLQAVVDGGADLWEGQSGRGVVRERLARRLLSAGRPADACAVAEALVAASPREGDPRARWRLLLAGALRACGARDDLIRARGILGELRDDAGLPAALRGPVLLELGDVLLRQEDPTAAFAAFTAIGDAAERLAPEERSRLRMLREEARKGSEAERLRVQELVGRIAEGGSQEQLRALGHRAARQVDTAIVAAVLAGDIAQLRSLLLATAALTGRTFDLPDDAPPDKMADVVAAARAALAELLARRPAEGGR